MELLPPCHHCRTDKPMQIDGGEPGKVLYFGIRCPACKWWTEILNTVDARKRAKTAARVLAEMGEKS